MDRAISMDDASLPDDPRLVDILSDEQMKKLAVVWNNGRDAYNDQPILPAHNIAPALVQRFIEIDGEPAAYGRAILVDGNALLCDVNAFPEAPPARTRPRHHGIAPCRSRARSGATARRPHRHRDGLAAL